MLIAEVPMKHKGDLSTTSFVKAAQDTLPPIRERNLCFISKRIQNFSVPEGFQVLWAVRHIMDTYILKESRRRLSPPDLFFDSIDNRSAPDRPTAFLSNNMVLTARYVQNRHPSREFEAAMIEFEPSGFDITCISKKTVQIGMRDGKGVICGQRVEYNICGVIEAETEIPGISHIVGLKVELVEVPGNPIFFFKAFVVPEQVLELMSKSGDQEWDRRGMKWKHCDVTRVLMGLKAALGLQSQ
jgi:hypothetical protein